MTRYQSGQVLAAVVRLFLGGRTLTEEQRLWTEKALVTQDLIKRRRAVKKATSLLDQLSQDELLQVLDKSNELLRGAKNIKTRGKQASNRPK